MGGDGRTMLARSLTRWHFLGLKGGERATNRKGRRSEDKNTALEEADSRSREEGGENWQRLTLLLSHEGATRHLLFHFGGNGTVIHGRSRIY